MYKVIALVLISCAIVAGLAVNIFSDKSTEPPISSSQIEASSPSVELELDRLLKITDSSERQQKLSHYLSQQMSISPLSTLASISQLKLFTDQQLCYQLALTAWFDKDAPALSSWLQNETPRAELDLALSYLIGLATTLPQKLLFSEKIVETELRNQTLNDVLVQWAAKEPEQAVRWSILQTDANKWLTLSFKLINKDSLENAIKSLSILDIKNSTQVRAAIQSLINNYEFGLVNDKALTALHELKPYPIKEEAIVGLLPLFVEELHLTLEDIEALLAQLMPGKLRDDYYEMVALNWAKKEPENAAKYAESLTEDGIRSRAVNAVISTWVEEDLEAADQWLKGLEGELDMAASTIGRSSARLGNVQISNEWIAEIKDEDLKFAAITEVLQGYYKDSPEAGIYQLVYQKHLTIQQKLELLHEIYPSETFLSPEQALDEIGRLEGLTNAYE